MLENPTTIPSEPTVSASEPLAYAPRPPAHRRLLRRVLVGLALIAIFIAAGRWGRPARDLAAQLNSMAVEDLINHPIDYWFDPTTF